MDWNFRKLGPALALTLIGVGSAGFAATKNGNDDQRKLDRQNKIMQACNPELPAPCFSTDTNMDCDNCLGPECVAGNAATRPITCGGDVVFTVSGFYWNAHQDGFEFGVMNNVIAPLPGSGSSIDPASLNTIIDGKYLNPRSKWNFGYKFGIGYNSTRDGWDFELLWTHFRNRASRSDNAIPAENNSIIPLWSAFASSAPGGNTQNNMVLFASGINSSWRLQLDLLDLDMGREFWNSKYVTLRPHIGLRYASIKQLFELEFLGGSWSFISTPATAATTGVVHLHNNFKGLGVAAGLESTWLIGRGFAFYGNLNLSLVYGRFELDHTENNTLGSPNFTKTPILEIEEGFHSTKAMTDLELGVEWTTMFSDCNYGFTLGLAWEHHMFFNQNQLWRINRLGASGTTPQPNNSGSNAFLKRRGDLSTQGWTLTATFDF